MLRSYAFDLRYSQPLHAISRFLAVSRSSAMSCGPLLCRNPSRCVAGLRGVLRAFAASRVPSAHRGPSRSFAMQRSFATSQSMPALIWVSLFICSIFSALRKCMSNKAADTFPIYFPVFGSSFCKAIITLLWHLLSQLSTIQRFNDNDYAHPPKYLGFATGDRHDTQLGSARYLRTLTPFIPSVFWFAVSDACLPEFCSNRVRVCLVAYWHDRRTARYWVERRCSGRRFRRSSLLSRCKFMAFKHILRCNIMCASKHAASFLTKLRRVPVLCSYLTPFSPTPSPTPYPNSNPSLAWNDSSHTHQHPLLCNDPSRTLGSAVPLPTLCDIKPTVPRSHYLGVA